MRHVGLLFCLVLVSSAFAQKPPQPAPRITVSSLSINDVAVQLPSRGFQKIIADVQRHTYTPESLSAEVAARVRYGYQRYGFFDSQVSTPSVRIINPGGAIEMAEITVSVNAGKQYRLDEISFDRVTVFPESQLRDLFKINRGEVFDTEKIRVGLDSLRKLYASDGFINTTPVPNTIENREAGTISLRIDCDEGVQFRLGSLTLDGVEARPGAGAQLLAHWGQYQGRVFAPEQVEDFLAQNTQWLPTGVEMEKNVEIKQDQATRLANLVLRLPDAPTARN